MPELEALCGQAEQRAQEFLAALQEQGEEPELYGSYIQERQAYCRAAIALCEEQLAGWTEDSCAWDYQTVSPPEPDRRTEAVPIPPDPVSGGWNG